MPFAEWHTMSGRLSMRHPTDSSFFCSSSVRASASATPSAAGAIPSKAGGRLTCLGSIAGSSSGTTKSSVQQQLHCNYCCNPMKANQQHTIADAFVSFCMTRWFIYLWKFDWCNLSFLRSLYVSQELPIMLVRVQHMRPTVFGLLVLQNVVQ